MYRNGFSHTKGSISDYQIDMSVASARTLVVDHRSSFHCSVEIGSVKRLRIRPLRTEVWWRLLVVEYRLFSITECGRSFLSSSEVMYRVAWQLIRWDYL